MSLITRYLEAVATGNGRFQSQADSDRLANHALDYLYAGDTDNAAKVRALMLPVRTVWKNDRGARGGS